MRRRALAALAALAVFVCWTSSAYAAPELLQLLNARERIGEISLSADRLYWLRVSGGPPVIRAKAVGSHHGITIGREFTCGAVCSLSLTSTQGRAWWVTERGARSDIGDVFTASNRRDERDVLHRERDECISTLSTPVARSGIALITLFRLDRVCNLVIGGTVYAASVRRPGALHGLPSVPVPAQLQHLPGTVRQLLALATAGGRLAVIPNPHGPLPSPVAVQVRSIRTGAAVTSFDVVGRVRSLAMTKRFVIVAVQRAPGRLAIRWFEARSGRLAGSHAVRPVMSAISAYGSRVAYGHRREIHVLDLDTNRDTVVRLCRRLPQELQISGRLLAWTPTTRLMRTVVGLRLPP